MQADGISYLDMGDAIIRGDWKMAINGYWSPLYPWLQGLAAWAIKPTPYWQFTVVHLVNFLIYLFALACFDTLLQALARGWQAGRLKCPVAPSHAALYLRLAMPYSSGPLLI